MEHALTSRSFSRGDKVEEVAEEEGILAAHTMFKKPKKLHFIIKGILKTESKVCYPTAPGYANGNQ